MFAYNFQLLWCSIKTFQAADGLPNASLGNVSPGKVLDLSGTYVNAECLLMVVYVTAIMQLLRRKKTLLSMDCVCMKWLGYEGRK